MDTNKVDDNSMKEFRRETLTLILVGKHKNLVSLIGVSYNDKKVYILLDYCSGGSLFELVHRTKEVEIEWAERIKFCKDIAEGMAYIHSFGLVHRDLKSLKYIFSLTEVYC